MPRRREVPKREILPDPVYNSQLVTKFINSLMTHGKKSVAESVFYGALKKVEDRAKDDPIKLLQKAVDNVKPALVGKTASRVRLARVARRVARGGAILRGPQDGARGRRPRPADSCARARRVWFAGAGFT